MSDAIGATAVFLSSTSIDDAKFWIDTRSQNFGWILLGDESGNRNARRFYSSEADENRPRLKIVTETSSAAAQWMLYR